MTFWDLLIHLGDKLDNVATRLLGIAGGTITVLLASNIIPDNQIKYYTAAIALLTFWRGQATATTVATAKQIIATQPPAPPLPTVTK